MPWGMSDLSRRPLRLLFLGDVVGRSGREAVLSRLPALRQAWGLDFVVVNAENAAGGFGITQAICEELLAAGADCVTLGNHAFDQREALTYIARQPRLLRPINYPGGAPGQGAGIFEAACGARVYVANVQGRVFMDQLDDPFAAIDRELNRIRAGREADVVVIDMHAETTAEKMALAHFVDGRASLVVGTHTHVPTADAQILAKGTGYLSDAGMCGDYDSVIGMRKEEPIRRFFEKTPGPRYEPATGEGTICGVGVEIERETGLALNIAPLRLGGRLAQCWPEFWGAP
jgi:2',3'-cyclic-nucleotide 2'-phosphodiesterase